MNSSQVGELYKTPKIIAVVGLSDKPERPSYQVASYLKKLGNHIIPVNPNIKEALGEESFESLLDVPAKVDIVDIFRSPEEVPEIVDQAIKIGADVIWMQEGVSHAGASQKARDAGITVIENMCMMKEHKKLKARS
ncbi:MAG: CoA-binding protein [Candidatus Paceibacterota bacterium]